MTQSLFDIAGKTALVTGGARGVGRFITQALVEAGVTVYMASRDAAAGEEAARTITGPGQCISLPADLSTPQGAETLAKALGEREERLHILVNNAGATEQAPLGQFQEDAWDKVMDLNVKSLFFLTQSVLPLLRAAATEGDPARVINIGSIAGTRTYAGDNFPYMASKAAVHHLSRQVARKLAPENITVNVIAPGPVAAGMLGRAATDAEFRAQLSRGIPLRRVAEQEDVAGSVIYLCSRAGSFLTGAVIPLDGGMTTCV